MGEWSCETPQETVAKQTRKRQRGLTVEIEEKKKSGHKGKAGEGLAGWVRPLYAYDENDHLVWCSAPSLVVAAIKKGDYVVCLICYQKVSFNKYS